MSQIIINTGNVANDGLGTPLRNAFNQVNYNFTQLFNVGPVSSNIVIANNSITATNTNGNLNLATNGIGSIVPKANFIPDIPNVRMLGAGTNRFNTVYAQYINANTGIFSGNVYVSGNLLVTGNVVTVDYSTISVANSNITLATGAANASQANGGGLLIPIADANFTYNYSANSWNSTIAITAPTFIGDGANLTNVIANVQATALLGNTISNAVNYSNLTNFGLIETLSASGNILTSGNVYANVISGNTITANYLAGNGGNITNITANAIVGNVPFALVANTAYVANLAALATQAINADTALFAINANLAAWANTATIAQTANASHYAIQADNANSAVVAGMAYELSPAANLSIAGNITTGGYFIGDGGLLSNVVVTTSYGNSNVVTLLGAFGSNTINTTGAISVGDVTLTNIYSPNYFANAIAFANANGYITTSSLFKYNPGTEVITVGAVSATGNITANYFIGNGSQLTGLAATYGNSNVESYLQNLSTDISTSGNVTAANISATDLNSNSIVYVGANGLLTTDSAFTYIDNGGELTLNVDYLNSPGIFTNDIYGQGNLILHPDVGNNFSAYLDVYLTGGPDIHIAANSENVIIGRDSGANVTVGVDGNVTIQADAGTPHKWTFGYNGITSLPDGTEMGEIEGGNTFGFYNSNANTQFLIELGPTYAWGFDGTNGNLTAPGNISASGNVTAVGFTTTGSSGNITGADVISANTFSASGNITGAYAFFSDVTLNDLSANAILYTDANRNVWNTDFSYDVNSNTMSGGNISLTGNITGNVANLYAVDISQSITWTGGSQVYEDSALILNGPLGVAISSPNAISIVSNSQTWAFDTDGSLTIPRNILAEEGNDLNVQVFNPDVSGGVTYTVQNRQVDLGNARTTQFEVSPANIILTTDFSGNRYQWNFDNTGNLTLPANTFAVNYANGTPVSIGSSDYGNANVANFLGDFGSNAISTSGNITASGLLIDTVTGITSNAGNININQITGLGGYLNAYGANLSGNINAVNLSLLGNIISDANISGNVNAANISAGNISLSGNIFAYGANIYSVNGLTMEGGNLTMSSITGMGGSISAEGNIIGTNLSATNLSATSNISGQNINGGNLSLSGNVLSNLNIQQGNISVSGNITSGSELTVVSANITGVQGLTVSGGDITIPSSMSGGSLSAYGNITGNYILGNGSQLTSLPAPAVTQDITSNGYMSIMTYDGNIKYTNYATVEPSSGNISGGNISATGNVSGGNLTLSSATGNIIAHDATLGGNVSVLGNVTTSGTFVGNGSGLTNVAQQTTGSWSVTAGTNTYSFTVPANATYAMWVRGNIPNGIIAWNATATVTNTNVPIVGQQFAWVYNGAGTPLDFVSIPNQFTGTGNAIVRSNVSPSITTNRFDFSINNTSGNTQIINYGYTTL